MQHPFDSLGLLLKVTYTEQKQDEGTRTPLGLVHRNVGWEGDVKHLHRRMQALTVLTKA
jgi:hypothetical protein